MMTREARTRRHIQRAVRLFAALRAFPPPSRRGHNDSGKGATSTPKDVRCEGSAAEAASGAATGLGDANPANAVQTRPPKAKIDLTHAPSLMEQRAASWSAKV